MRGVSPVVATVLMVAVAIAAAVIAYNWVSGVMASSTSAASAQQGEIGKYKLSLESVKCDASATSMTLTLYIRNDSDVTVNDSFLVIVQDTAGNEISKEYETINIGPSSTQSKTVTVSATQDMSNKKINVILRGPHGINLTAPEPVTCT